MARINLSVPDELKARMDSLGGVNWSMVAQEAFTWRAQIEEKLMNVGSDAAGIERLRMDKTRAVEDQHAEGLAAGRRWATEAGSYVEVKRVAKLHADCDASGTEIEAFDVVSAMSDEKPDWRDVSEFWERWGDSEEPSSEYAAGFAEGVALVFDEI